MHLRRPLLSALLAASAACGSEPVRLHHLREAPPGTEQAAAYQRLEQAVALCNEFLHTGSEARVFPSERATFFLGFSDVLVEYRNEGIEAVRLNVPGWGDLRTEIGDGVHADHSGLYTARRTGPAATGESSEDGEILELAVEDMAATLLRMAALQRELQARGEPDFWLNHDVLGIWPSQLWGADNPVQRRAYAVERAFRAWLASERGVAPTPPPEPEPEQPGYIEPK